MKYDDWSKMIFVDNLDFNNLLKEQRLSDNIPCIYFLFDDWELIYIGETTNLRSRSYKHYYEKQYYSDIKNTFVSPFNKIGYLELETLNKDERYKIEQDYIENYKPKYNDYNWYYETQIYPMIKEQQEKYGGT